MKKIQIQEQVQTTAFQKQTTYNMFFITLEWLEKYIEVAYGDYFPNWQNRKQMHGNNIKRTDIDGNPVMAEDSLSTQLLLFRSTLSTKPLFLREEIKQEYYKWISATGIDVNNCPERLKHFLFGIHEIMEGRGEKILEDLRNKQIVDSTSPEFMEQMQRLFVYSHAKSKEVEEREKSLEGKTHKDIEIESKFGSGITEQGEEVFRRIASDISTSHGRGFHFFPQKGQQSNIPQHRANSEIIQNIRQNPRNWRVDDIITEFDNSGRTRQETVLIHQSARLDDYNQQTGKLNFDGNTIYRADRFSAEEIAQIQQALNIQQEQVQQQNYQWSWQK